MLYFHIFLFKIYIVISFETSQTHELFSSVFLTSKYLGVFKGILFLFTFIKFNNLSSLENTLFNLNTLKCIVTCFMAQDMVYLFEYSMCTLEVVTCSSVEQFSINVNQLTLMVSVVQIIHNYTDFYLIVLYITEKIVLKSILVTVNLYLVLLFCQFLSHTWELCTGGMNFQQSYVFLNK